MPLAPGDSVGRFTLRAPLGAGGMGEVFRAHDPQLDREVALKILRREPDDTASAALLREARVAASLDHPHVVAVFEVGEAPGAEPDGRMAYMTMELVDGRPLKTFVGDRDRSVESVVGWLVEIAQALGFAHRRGLVHGDVKPSNVMVRDDGHTKLLDFGIARRVARRDPEAVTRTDTRTASSSAASAVPENAGTPAYMAPEQLLGQPIDGRTDQFAWGVMAYELLCGARPWLSEKEPVQLAAEILSRMPPPPAEVSARVPDVVSRVVMRALAKSPEARFATMDDLVADLVMPAPASASTGRSVQREGGEEGRPAKERNDRRARALVVAVVLVAAVVVAFVVASRGGASDRAASAPSSLAAPTPAPPTSTAPPASSEAPSAPSSTPAASTPPASSSVASPVPSGAAPAVPKTGTAPARPPSGAVDPKGRPIFWSP